MDDLKLPDDVELPGCRSALSVPARRPGRLVIALAWMGFRVPGSEGSGEDTHCPPVLPEVIARTVVAMWRHRHELPALRAETGETYR